MNTLQIYYYYDRIFKSNRNDKESSETITNNLIETIRILASKGYNVSFLVNVNSKDEYINKIREIINNIGLNNAENIDVIAIPKVIDNSIQIKLNGSILIDTCLENIIKWEEMGGIGVFFGNEQHDSYITINEPLDLINIVLSLDKNVPEIILSGVQKNDEILLKKAQEKCSKVPVDNSHELEYIANKLKRSKHSIERALHYYTLVKENHIIDRRYNLKRMEEIIMTLNYYYDIANKKRLFTYELSDSIHCNLLKSLLEMDLMTPHASKNKDKQPTKKKSIW